jgi:hypothetical protein
MAMTCPKCGTSFAAGALSCPSCGQTLAAAPPKATGPATAGAKRMPVAALVVLIGGLVVLLGAVTLYRSGGLFGPGNIAPTAVTEPAGQPAAAANPADAGAQTAMAAPPPAAVPAAPPPSVTPAPAPVAAVPAPAAASQPAAPQAPAPASVPAPAPVAKPAPPPPPPPFRKTYECRESATFKVDPDTAIVTVDGEAIGIADEFADTPRTGKYKFKNEGVHYVKLSHRNYETLWLRFIVSKDALDKTAIVEIKLKEEK